MNIVILGGSGGIGRAFVDYFLKKDSGNTVHATFNKHEPDRFHKRCHWHHLEADDEKQMKYFCDQLDEVDICINTVGMLHTPDDSPEKTVRQASKEFLMHNFQINTLPTLLLSKFMPEHFRHDRDAVFAAISARVGSIEENYLGGWYSYRASKAALNMILKSLSIEWKRVLPNVAVAALHPGTTDTELSRPFQKNVPEGHLFTPAFSVQQMMQVVESLTPADSGHFWSFDGQKLPW